jgi:hypothetical protein
MFHMVPEQAFSVAAIIIVLVPPLALGLWWHWRRRRKAEEAAEWAEGRVAALEEALSTAPDAWFAWFHDQAQRDDDGGTQPEPAVGAETEVCSRRLAVLLSLFAGRQSTFADVLGAFRLADADVLRGAAAALRMDGAGFEEVLTLHDDGIEGAGGGAGGSGGENGPAARPSRGVGRRFIRVTGQRAVADNGRALADLLWLRDVTAEEAALARRRSARRARP